MRTLISLLFILFFSNIFSQFSFNHDDFEVDVLKNKIHRITQTEKGSVTRIEEYDSLGRNVFSYNTLYCGDNWNKKYIFYLHAFIYDNQNRVILQYYLHSNAGHIRTYFHYDSSGNKTVYVNRTHDHRSDQINTNPYHKISEYKNYNDVIASSEIKELNDNKSSVQLYSKEIFDNEKKIKEIEFSEKGDTSWITEYKYEKERIAKTISYSFEESRKELYRVFTSENISDTVFIEKLINLNNNLLTDTIFHIKEIYNSHNKILRKKTFEENKIEEYIYHYDSKGKPLFTDFYVLKRFWNETYPYSSESKKAQKVYRYNKQGLVKMEIIITKSPTTKEKRKYKYMLEYY